jgi:hypothetical protein
VRVFVAIRGTHLVDGPSHVGRRGLLGVGRVFGEHALRLGISKDVAKPPIYISWFSVETSRSESMEDDSSSEEEGDIS